MSAGIEAVQGHHTVGGFLSRCLRLQLTKRRLKQGMFSLYRQQTILTLTDSLDTDKTKLKQSLYSLKFFFGIYQCGV